MPVDVTEDYVRIRHATPGAFDSKSFRTITLKSGIKAVVACPRGKYSGGKCKVGMRVQSYLFSKSKGWTVSKAKAWISKHSQTKKKEPIIY